MQIKIWSDFVCPFCYIGASNLEKALANFEHASEVEIEYKSYQLEPGATYNPDYSYLQAMAERKDTSEEEISGMFEQVVQMATHAGLSYNLKEAKLTDTFPAHRVSQYVKEHGKNVAFYNKLYEAFFTNGELISDEVVISRIVAEIGLDGAYAREIIQNEALYVDEVEADIFEAQQIGLQGVPFFVFNNQYAVSGAQPVETFEQVLNQVYSESQ